MTMNVGGNLSSIKKKIPKESPDSFRMDNSPALISGSLQKKPNDDLLIRRLQKTMNKAIHNECYVDAIFFADKILALSIPCTEQYIRAAYDLAKAYFMNKEYMRCINIIDKQQVIIAKYGVLPSMSFSEKFRILQAQAYLKSKNIDKCIEVIEKKHPDIENLSSFEMSVFEEEESNYFKGLKHLILAKAYECQENNQ